MPQITRCAGCGRILYEGHEIIPPEQVLDRVGGKCPGCGRRLSLSPEKVEVKPCDEETPEPRKRPIDGISKFLRKIV